MQNSIRDTWRCGTYHNRGQNIWKQECVSFSQRHDNSVGFYAGMTTGTPIHVFVPNTDQRGGVSIYSSSFLDTYFVINETETYGSWTFRGQEFNKHIHLCRITVKWLRHTDLPMQMQPMTSSMVLELCRYILLYTYKYKLSYCTTSCCTFSGIPWRIRCFSYLIFE